MNILAKTLVLSAMIGATTIAAIAPASADDFRRRHHRHDNDGIALGAAGLAAGVLLGGALASRPRYVEPGPRYIEEDPVYVEPGYEEPVQVYRPRARVYVEEPQYREVRSLRPWSGAWMQYCSQRYRSFDRRSGTYVGYDGQEHFCTAGG